MKSNQKILIIDDDRLVGSSISLLLKKKDYEIVYLSHPSKIKVFFQENRVDLVILDMNFAIDTSGKQGLAALQLIQSLQKNVPVILITGWATVQLAVTGMKYGAVDFFAKPWENAKLLESIDKFIQTQPVITQNPNYIVGKHESIQQLWKIIRKVSQTDASILISGPSGSGKELIAEAIHQNSNRVEAPLVKVNLGAIPSTLFESEMFGVSKGAFTGAERTRIGKFEKANNGTIFLDEIGELAIENQVKLLRILQERQFEKLGSNLEQKLNVRIVSATNKDLPKLISEGKFRDDLYYRLNVIEIKIPSLDERKSDIPILAKHFVEQLNNIYDRAIYLELPTLKWLENQSYAGNVRQLKNMIQRAYILSEKASLSIKDFQQADTISIGEKPIQKLNELEKRMVQRALKYYNFNISKSADSLGITRSALYRKMTKHKLERE